MIRYCYGYWAYGFSNGSCFVDFTFENEQEIESFLNENKDVKIQEFAFNMMDDKYKIKLEKYKE